MERDKMEKILKKIYLLGEQLWKAVFICMITASCVSSAKTGNLPNWIKNQPSGINFTDIAPSPDGKIIAFEYIDRSLGRNYLGLGLLNLQNGNLTRIHNPAGRQLSQPSFSDDGKSLLVAIGAINGIYPNQIGLISLATMNVTLLTAPGLSQMYPVLQPETGNILYVQSTEGLLSGMRLLNPTTKTQQVIINEENGFHFVMRPSFINKNEIIFQASGSYEAELRQKTVEFGSFLLAYRLKFGEKPQLLSLEAERQARKIIGNEGSFNWISTSKAGDFITYMGAVPSATSDKPDKILRELFKLEDGKVVQITNHHSTMLIARTSYDGSVIAFVSDVTDPYKFDLFIYNVRTGKTIPTNLLDRIRNDSTFALK